MARLLVAAAALAAAAAAPPPRLRGAQRAIAQTIPHTRHWLAGAAGDDPTAADDAAADDDDPSFVRATSSSSSSPSCSSAAARASRLKRFEQLSVDRLRNASVRVRFAGEAGISGRRVGSGSASSRASSSRTAARPLRRAAREQLRLQPRPAELTRATTRRGAPPLASFAAKIGGVWLLRFARFVAKALRERVTIPATLFLPLLKHVLGVPLSFSDLEADDILPRTYLSVFDYQEPNSLLGVG
ncbi:ubiquitin protein ligase [Aureococcus anophagefferens]|nr:ubiquitin protein ligase [Aureococcus anophagefferens]